MKIYLFVFTFLTCLQVFPQENSFRVEGKNLTQLLKCIDKHKNQIIKKKKRHESSNVKTIWIIDSPRKKNALRKRLLAKDTCQMIYDSDTIRILYSHPSIPALLHDKYCECIVGGKNWLSYSNRDWGQVYDQQSIMVMNLILGNEYEQYFGTKKNYPEGTQIFQLYELVKESPGVFLCIVKRFVYRWDDIDDDKKTLYLI